MLHAPVWGLSLGRMSNGRGKAGSMVMWDFDKLNERGCPSPPLSNPLPGRARLMLLELSTSHSRMRLLSVLSFLLAASLTTAPPATAPPAGPDTSAAQDALSGKLQMPVLTMPFADRASPFHTAHVLSMKEQMSALAGQPSAYPAFVI